MLPDIERTIVALASGAAASERAIIRITGPDTRRVLTQLLPVGFTETQWLDSLTPVCVDTECWLPAIRRCLAARILYWPNERSYTGQPSAEVHTIGCMPLVESIIQRCCELGAEPAERGEFTLRAFLSGKLDLAQAEAVLGVIEADTQAELTTALTQLGGNLAPAIEPLRRKIVDVLAELEAALDFVDEDIQFITPEALIEQLTEVRSALDDFAQRLDTRSSSQTLPRVALVGLPNSGKSTLFNALSGRDLAIVADIAGTTRDYLEQSVNTQAGRIVLVDTAGWEELDDDSPRAMAQQQIVGCIERAQLVVLCIDISQRIDHAAIERSIARVTSFGTLQQSPWLIVLTKNDLPHKVDEDAQASLLGIAKNAKFPGFQPQIFTTSCEDAIGLQALKAELGRLAYGQHMQSGANSESTSSPLLVVHQTAVRCRSAIAASLAGLDAAIETARDCAGDELIAAELRLVLDELATIIGEVHSDDILGEIFSRFCIGK